MTMHLPYSPDLAPRDYFLFRNLKFLHVRQSPDDDVVKKAVTGYFNTQDVSFFLRVFDHWRRSGLSLLKSKRTSLNNSEVSFIIRCNFHAQVENLLFKFYFKLIGFQIGIFVPNFLCSHCGKNYAPPMRKYLQISHIFLT